MSRSELLEFLRREKYAVETSTAPDGLQVPGAADDEPHQILERGRTSNAGGGVFAEAVAEHRAWPNAPRHPCRRQRVLEREHGWLDVGRAAKPHSLTKRRIGPHEERPAGNLAVHAVTAFQLGPENGRKAIHAAAHRRVLRAEPGKQEHRLRERPVAPTSRRARACGARTAAQGRGHAASAAGRHEAPSPGVERNGRPKLRLVIHNNFGVLESAPEPAGASPSRVDPRLNEG